MREEVVLANMVKDWAAAAVGPIKDKLFNGILDFLVKHPHLVEGSVKAGSEIAEGYARRLAAATATAAAANTVKKESARLPFKTFLARFTANFGAGPKGPNPYLIAATILGSVLISGAEAHAEGMERQRALPAYEAYVVNYLTKMAKAKQFHPQNNAYPSPKEFDEWYAENYQ